MYILFDIGGTNTRVAGSLDCEVMVAEPVVFESSDNFEDDIDRLVEEARMLVGGHLVRGIAGGIAGVLDDDKRSLVHSPNKKAWEGKNFVERLEKEFGAPVFVENDTANVGLGEAHVGAGKGHDIVAYITVSTGVGGARIVDGRIDRARFGFEPGHQIVNPHCKVCSECVALPVEDGSCFDMEDLASGTALEKRTGKKPYEVEDEEEWHTIARLLALGLHNTIVHWSPDVVVLGGSMMCGKLGPVVGIDDIKKHLRETLHIFPEIPEIKKAELGNFGGLHGAMVRLRQGGVV